MKKTFLVINVCCYLAIAGFLALSVARSLSSGYPWALTCYNCFLCRHSCPYGIDPHGFITAAISDAPDLYVTSTNIRLRLGEALALDPDMIVTNGDDPKMTASQVLAEGVTRDTEVTVFKMRARDVAKFCTLCGNCEKVCPISLPLMNIIEDLRDDGTFNR